MDIRKQRTDLAPVTSIRLLHDGLHVTAVGYQDRRTVKKIANPTRKKAKG